MTKCYANIYNYVDYRKFLSDYQKNRQVADKTFTKSAVCKKMGMPNNRGYLQNVIAGRKDVTSTFIERFIWVLELNEDEAQFFRVLVLFNQSSIERERNLLFDQLIALNNTPQTFVNPDAYEYYKQWYPSVIRALLDVENFSGNFGGLAKRLNPRVSAQEAKKAISLLKKLDLIKKNKAGYWKPTGKVIHAGSYVESELIKQYQIQCLDIAKKTVLTRTDQRKNISTLTLSMSRDARNKIEKKLQKFKSEVNALVHKDPNPAECVYQLNIQYYSHLNAKPGE